MCIEVYLRKAVTYIQTDITSYDFQEREQRTGEKETEREKNHRHPLFFILDLRELCSVNVTMEYNKLL